MTSRIALFIVGDVGLVAFEILFTAFIWYYSQLKTRTGKKLRLKYKTYLQFTKWIWIFTAYAIAAIFLQILLWIDENNQSVEVLTCLGKPQYKCWLADGQSRLYDSTTGLNWAVTFILIPIVYISCPLVLLASAYVLTRKIPFQLPFRLPIALGMAVLYAITSVVWVVLLIQKWNYTGVSIIGFMIWGSNPVSLYIVGIWAVTNILPVIFFGYIRGDVGVMIATWFFGMVLSAGFSVFISAAYFLLFFGIVFVHGYSLLQLFGEDVQAKDSMWVM